MLIDKTPLSRSTTTPSCLVELERVRTEIHKEESSGANSLGVRGKMVEKLKTLVLVRPKFVSLLNVVSLSYGVRRSEHLEPVTYIRDRRRWVPLCPL